MSRIRYITSIVFSALTVVGIMFMLSDSIGMGLLVGLVVAPAVGEAILWCDSVLVRACLLLSTPLRIIFVFWFNLTLCCSPLWFIVGLAIAPFVFGVLGSILSFVVSVFVTPALFFYIYHLISYSKDLY